MEASSCLLMLTATLLLCTSVLAASVTDPAHRLHQRVKVGDKLSQKQHYHGVDEPSEGHDADYDHEAFLGTQEAHEFDQLSPEESQRRLAVIVDRIDQDQDGFVTLEEMRKWIRSAHDRYISEDVERQWTQHNADNKDNIGWEEYRSLVYGFLDDPDDQYSSSDEQSFSYKKMEARDQRRWAVADEDGDGALNKLEFMHFLHPEEADHMRDIVIQETIDDIDKDGDGKISLKEYIGDMYQSNDDPDLEPDWVRSEREAFNKYRDENQDGFMDQEEVQKWILPPDYDHVQAESKHLIFEADSDGDHKLTKQEILDKYDLFVGSQATDFGEALSRHDEF